MLPDNVCQFVVQMSKKLKENVYAWKDMKDSHFLMFVCQHAHRMKWELQLHVSVKLETLESMVFVHHVLHILNM